MSDRFEHTYGEMGVFRIIDTKRIIVDCLNEQQDKISELEEELEESSVFIIEQRKENKKLNEENEKLRKELDSFKPVMFQDVRKGTVILYSKGD